MLEDLLSLLGHQVIAVADAEAGLARLKAARFDVLLTGLHLPGMSGLALAGQVRIQAPAVRIVIASGAPASDPEFQASGYRTLLKPYKVEQLQAALALSMAQRESASCYPGKNFTLKCCHRRGGFNSQNLL